MKNILSEKQQIDSFDQAANDYKNWFRKARSLHFSARELFKIYTRDLNNIKRNEEDIAPISMFIGDQILLLEGFSIECVLKWLYVGDGNKISENGKIKKISNKPHDLLERCKITNTDLNDNEEKIFKTLSLIIVSYGRYPIPFKYSENPLTKTKERGYEPAYMWNHNDMNLINNFIISILGEEKEMQEKIV